MMDKGHCQLNPDDEEEYEEFYDFSRRYNNSNLTQEELKTRKERKDG
jgi:hypothetical protein